MISFTQERMGMIMQILRRTFQAAKANTEAERAELNGDALTSQYYPSQRYLVREPFPNHPTQKHIGHTFRTRKEAEAWVELHGTSVQPGALVTKEAQAAIAKAKGN
jgi:hypothetical protein